MHIDSAKSFFILACLLITVIFTGYSQNTIQPDTTVHLAVDTTQQAGNDSFLDDKVNYKSEDSITADLVNKKAFLYNKAEVYYQDMILKAGYIEIDFEKKLVVATGIRDSTGKTVQRPVFEQGDQKFTAGEITYNFESKKGKIKDVITQQGEGYIHGTDIKKDTSNMYYVARGRYTTCDLEDDPHYYLQAKKIKVIPDNKIITGPAELYIADVPTPLVLPFGYFPNKRGRRSGIILPAYGETDRLGFFLSNGGFYYGGSELFDAALLGDIYSTGGFSLRTISSYNKRYKFSGNVTFSYAHLYTLNANPELDKQPTQNDFKLTWGHNQDPKSHPDSRFSAAVNFGTSTYGRYNGGINTDYINTTYASNLTYYKSFTGTPFSLVVSGRHNQNVLSRMVDIELPNINANMTRLFPFKNNNRIGKRWYDQVSVSANLNAKNYISAPDSLIFKEATLSKKLMNGAQLVIPISTTFTILKYITVTPSINTTTNLYFQTINKTYRKDTNNIYQVFNDTVRTARMSNEVSANAAFTTNVFGDYFFKTKHLKQIHHVLMPNVSFNFRPDYSQRGFGYYRSYHDSLQNEREYSIFEGGIYGGPGTGKIGSVNFGLNNIIEAKIKNDSDSGEVYKKLSLLDNLSANIAYNAAAKQFKWSYLSLGARTRLFNKFDINTSALFDLYQRKQYNKNGNISIVRMDTMQFKKGGFAHLVNAGAAISTNFRSKEKTGNQNPNSTQHTDNTEATPNHSSIREELQYIYDHPNAYIDFDVPWTVNLSYNLYYTPILIKLPDQVAKPFTQTITFSGDVSITRNWKISLYSGFDFNTNKLTVTSINVARDLHCWELHFNWVPFGFRQSFMLEINVKSSMLKDLRLKKQSPNNTTITGY